jgi:hypothetical protein
MFGEEINQRCGATIIFREPSKRLSFQAIAGDDESCLPPGAVIIELILASNAKGD